MADDPNTGIPKTVVKKSSRSVPGHTGSSKFVGVAALIVVVGGIGFSTYKTMEGSTSSAQAATSPEPIPTVSASASPVPDPTDSATSAPAPRASVRVVTVTRVAYSSAGQSGAHAPQSSQTMSPRQQYATDEEARTLASRRSSSTITFSQDDQAREDLANVSGRDRPQPVPRPTAAPTSLFASDGASGADRFLARHQGSVGYIPAVSRYQVSVGTIMQLATSSAADSTFPEGIIRCMVTSPVFASHGHTDVAIPQGTTLLVKYNANMVSGDARLQSIGTRLLLEDGREFDMGGTSQAYGAQGEAGMVASVDTHAGRAFGNAVMSALLQSAINLSSHASTNINLGSVNAPQPSQLSPTMHVKIGVPFTVMVGEDLPLDRYEVQ